MIGKKKAVVQKSRFEQLYELMGKPYYVVMWENKKLRSEMLMRLICDPFLLTLFFWMLTGIRIDIIAVYLVVDLLHMRNFEKMIYREKERLIRNEVYRLHPEREYEELYRKLHPDGKDGKEDKQKKEE